MTTDGRTAHVAAALDRRRSGLGDNVYALAEAALAAADEWDTRPDDDATAIIGPLTRRLAARDEALDWLVDSWDTSDRTVGSMLALRRIDAVVEAHRALVAAQAGDL